MLQVVEGLVCLWAHKNIRREHNLLKNCIQARHISDLYKRLTYYLMRLKVMAGVHGRFNRLTYFIL